MADIIPTNAPDLENWESNISKGEILHHPKLQSWRNKHNFNELNIKSTLYIKKKKL